MFGNSENDLKRSLGEMATQALKRCYSNRKEAVGVLETYIRNDRRYDGFSPSVLSQRAMEVLCHAGALDLSDPRLRGQAPRPLERDQSW